MGKRTWNEPGLPIPLTLPPSIPNRPSGWGNMSDVSLNSSSGAFGKVFDHKYSAVLFLEV